MGFVHFRRLAACLILFSLPILAAVPAAGRVVNRVVATVDGSPITLYRFEQYVLHNTGGMQLHELLPEQKEEVLDGLVTDTLISLEATQRGLHVTNADVEDYIQQIMLANDLDEKTLYAALAQQGLDAEGYRTQIRRELLKNQLVSREIRQRVNISDQQVKSYYEAHPEEFSIPAAVDLSHILFLLPPNAQRADAESLASRAREAHQRLLSGESFEKVAREMSDAPDASDGGRIGRMEKGQMMPEIEQVALALPPGEVSHPVQSGIGVHILRVNERGQADLVPLDSVREQIKERLYAEAIQERFESWADEDLREGHAVEKRI